MRLHRRELLVAGPLIAAGLSLPALRLRAAPVATIHLQSARATILPGTVTEGLVSSRQDGPPAVLRARQGQPFAARVENATPDYTAMHWHGVRVPVAMDGVPYLTQFPIGHGEGFDYAFTPADAGTYWYHPHCMTMDQMARGMTGALVVDEAEDPGFDADIVLNLKDFHLAEDGSLGPFWTPRGAARAGTLGNVMTVNWQVGPVVTAPAGGLLRLRLLNSDTARMHRLYLPGAVGRMVARDGHPLVVPMPLPVDETSALLLAPGQRADLVLRMPSGEGADITLMTVAAGGAHSLATLRSIGGDLRRDVAEIVALPPNPVAEPEIPNARVEEFVFGWSPDGRLPDDGLCGTLGYTFWSINRVPWLGDAAAGAGPLATFRLGESVVLRLRNESPNSHPIHLHGMTFRVIASDKRSVADNWTDTALLQRGETLTIAFVADNPGDWAFHCHVIEHQKTGLAGYIRVGG